MKRIDDRTVELTEVEQACHMVFQENLSRGDILPLAAKLALNRFAALGRITEEFATYLSDGTVKQWGSRWVIRPEWRDVKPRSHGLAVHVPPRAVALIPVEYR